MKFSFLVFLLVAIFDVSAQKNIGGTVENNDIFIDFAQVYIQDNKGKILNYTFTDSLGSFYLTFETDSDSILLSISRLGYKSFKQTISSSQTTITVQLSLAEESKLKEVIIEDRPVKSQGDTLNYFVQSFRDGSEKNVEDILAKLPGVSVDQQSGIIKYQGKEIKKILLDGDDLTGDNYKVLSKNLSADWLEEVDILKKFTGSRLLQGIKQSDEIAINLKLKEEAKAPLFGSIELGSGNTAKYLAKTELLSYLKKMKVFALGEANNTGTDLQSYDIETYTESQLEYKGFILPKPIINHQLEVPPFLKQERFTFHEGQFISNNFIVNLSPKSSLRSITTLYNNNLQFNFTDSLNYFLPSGEVFSFVQNQAQRQTLSEFFQDIKITNQVSPNKDLIIRFQSRHDKDQPLTTNNTGTLIFTDQSEKIEKEWFSGLSYIHKLNSNWVNSLDVEVGNHTLNEAFIVSKENILIDSIQQSTNQSFFNIGMFNQLNGVIKKNWFVNILAGWSSNYSDLSYIQNKLINNNSISNSYSFNHLYTQFKLEKKIKNTKMSFDSKLRNVGIKYNNKLSSDFYFEPTVTISSKKNLGQIETEIKGIYNIEYIFIKPHQLVKTPLLTNYRTFMSFNTNPFNPIKKELSVVNLTFTEDAMSYMSANVELGFLKAKSILTPQLIFIRDAVYDKQTQSGMSKSIFSQFSLDKYFSKFKSIVKASYGFEQNVTPLSIEDRFSESQENQQHFSITSGTSITKHLKLSFAFTHTKSINEWEESINKFNSSSYFAKVVYKPFSSFRITIDYHNIRFRKINTVNDIANASIYYSIFEDKFSLELTANNIFNKDAIVLFNNQPSVLTNSIFPLQPQFIFLSALYRF